MQFIISIVRLRNCVQLSERNKVKLAMSLLGKTTSRNIVALTRRRCRFAEGAIISWYARRDAKLAGVARETREKDNHNFQLFLSCARSLHHADNIILYFQAAASFPVCHYLLRHLRVFRWLYAAKAAPDFLSRASRMWWQTGENQEEAFLNSCFFSLALRARCKRMMACVLIKI